MLTNIYQIVSDIFNGGFSQDGFTIKGTSPCIITISYQDESIEVYFTKNQPLVSFTKDLGIIKPSLNKIVLGIELGKTSGTIKLKNFIDIPFNYE